MLKWLKQKPTTSGDQIKGGTHHLSDRTTEVGRNKIITDDPLATIPIHPQHKKSKSKSEEIYAVSRVNPIFEEEEVNRAAAVGANNSGSSGYDSGSQVSNEDDELKLPQNRRTTDSSSTSSTSSFCALSRVPHRQNQLFHDDEDHLVHHQAAILSSDGRPVLHIVEQNPDFVQSIAVAVDERRRTFEVKDAIKSRKTSIHPIPTRSPSSDRDNVGIAKLVHKENRYVQSIVIGKSEGKFSSGTPSSSKQAFSKKPSVTFSERIELVPEHRIDDALINPNPSQLLPYTYRKSSTEHDSIVTESLLLLTSSKPAANQQQTSSSSAPVATDLKWRNDSNHIPNPPSKLQQRKTSSSSSSSGEAIVSQRISDLEALSSSIRKNRPIKQIHINAGKGGDHGWSEYRNSKDHSHPYHHSPHTRNESDGQGDASYEDDENTTTGSSSNGEEEGVKNENRNCGSRQQRGSSCPKSPFGGIADHYAAAKEIAKEIESYSNGSAKTASKKSIVRELLSGKGREALAARTALRKVPLEQKRSVSGSAHPYPISNDGIDDWESVRVQQVYLKGRSWKDVERNLSSSSSGSSSDGDRFRFAGQRVLSVTEGQVQLEQNLITKASSVHSSASSSASSSSSSKQHLKGYIDDALPKEVQPSRNAEDDVSSDSGNSTDRNSKGSRDELLLADRRVPTTPRPKIPPKSPDPSSSSQVSESSDSSAELSHGDKVMIVTGDSQNMVVDLSGIPQDLRDAIVSGTALITFPDGLNANSKGGYTIVSIPSSSSSPKEPIETYQLKTEEPAIETISKPSFMPTKLDVHQDIERGELYDRAFNSYRNGSNNKSQVWATMQQGLQQTLIEDENGKKKRITTVLPFHPNQDVYKSPDFTMEGQRMERQRKKMEVAKKRRCFCRVFGIFFFLTVFIGVLVALSMIYTRGQKYFGPVGPT